MKGNKRGWGRVKWAGSLYKILIQEPAVRVKRHKGKIREIPRLSRRRRRFRYPRANIHSPPYSIYLLYLFSPSRARAIARRCFLRDVEGSGKSYLRVRGIILLGMQIKPFKGPDELPELLACLKKERRRRQRAKKSQVSPRWSRGNWRWRRRRRRNQHEFE